MPPRLPEGPHPLPLEINCPAGLTFDLPRLRSASLLPALFTLLVGLLLLALVLDAHDLAGDGADLHLGDRALRVAYVERVDEPPVLALKLGALDVSGRAPERRGLRLLLRDLGLARKLLLLLLLSALSRPRRGCRKRRSHRQDDCSNRDQQ